MRKTIIKILLLILIIGLLIILYNLSLNTKKGTISSFYDIDTKSIKYVICNNQYVNTDEFIGIYLYDIFEVTEYDNTSYPINTCMCYDTNNNLILEFIEFDNNTYYFSDNKINIGEITTAYYITK